MYHLETLNENILSAGRIIRLPTTKKGWIVVGLGILIYFILELLFGRLLTNMKAEHRRILEGVVVFVIIIILELIIEE